MHSQRCNLREMYTPAGSREWRGKCGKARWTKPLGMRLPPTDCWPTHAIICEMLMKEPLERERGVVVSTCMQGRSSACNQRTFGAASGHRERRVQMVQLPFADLARVVSDLGEEAVHLRFESLLHRAAGRRGEVARVEGVRLVLSRRGEDGWGSGGVGRQGKGEMGGGGQMKKVWGQKGRGEEGVGRGAFLALQVAARKQLRLLLRETRRRLHVHNPD